MIISHLHKFIFLKTTKTAGTSIEIALSQHCGPDDIIAPTQEEDEQIRRQLGFRGPQNCNVAFSRYSLRDWIWQIGRTRRRRFRSHDPAAQVLAKIGEDIWNDYFIFCFERNPFDKAVSRYFWSRRDEREDMRTYLDRAPVEDLSNWHIYTINHAVVADFVGRYERLTDDLQFIWRKFNFPGEPHMPRAKGQYRTDRRHYSQLLDAACRQRIEQVCAREIEHFGYRFEDLGAASTRESEATVSRAI